MMVRSCKQNEAGYVLVTVAAMLVVFVGFTALAIDTGMLFADRTQAQRAADAAALAGAMTFIVDTESSQPETQLEKVERLRKTAEAYARATALKNKVMGVEILTGQVEVCVGDIQAGSCVTNVAAKRVAVTITRQEPTFFAKVLGSAFMNVTSRVQAFAEAALSPSGATCVKPFFLPNTAFATYSQGQLSAVCTTGTQLLIAGDTVTDFARSKFGAQFVVKPQDPDGKLVSSQYYEINVTGNANDYEEVIGKCWTQSSVCKSTYNVITGVKKGPTTHGVDDLIGNPPKDLYEGIGRYRVVADNTLHDTSRALGIVPIWDPCTTNLNNGDPFSSTEEFPSGQGQAPALKIVGFAQLFVEQVDNSGNPEGVIVRLINVSACSADSGFEDGSTSFSFPLRLIRPQ